MEYLLREIAVAEARGHHQREATLTAELQWLNPNCEATPM
jgi:hypothetical protein